MQIITFTADTAPTGFEFLAVIVHGSDFHPVTPFRSSTSAADAEAKAQAWWDSELAKAAQSEAGKAARAAKMRDRKKAAAVEPEEIEESF